MRIEQLAYFLEIAKTNSINKAAENLFVTQPGLSDSVKKMESELGLQLLNRSKTGVSLTENGKIVALHASIILSAYQDMLKDLSLIADSPAEQLKGTIVIATTPLFAASVLTDVNGLFRQLYPHVHIRYFELGEADILEWTKIGRADFGFFASTQRENETAMAIVDTKLHQTPLCQDELVICLAQRSPMAIHKFFPASFIETAKTVTFQSPDQPMPQNIVAISNNIVTQIDILLQAEAVAPVPRQAFERCFASTKGLVSRPIRPAPLVTYNMVCLAGRKLHAIEEAYIQTLQDHIAKNF